MTACGLDFGTSNSAIGVWRDGTAELVPLEGGDRMIPSALFYDFGAGQILFGREAVAAYITGEDGRLLRALKSVLGTGLMAERTQMKSRKIAFTDVITTFVRHLKGMAERHCEQELDTVVHGRPVHFVDGDPEADRQAETALREIAIAGGFRQVVFQYEPIAAARYLESRIDREQVALVADIGGGTSDISIVRIGPDRLARADRAADILANDGIRLGGTDFDRLLSLDTAMPELGMGSSLHGKSLSMPRKIYFDLSTWARINHVYGPATLREIRDCHRQAREPRKVARLLHLLQHHQVHRLIGEVEQAKIRLSLGDRTAIDMACVEPQLQTPVTRDRFERSIADECDRLCACIRQCLSLAGLRPDQIGTVMLTGGSTLLPAVNAAITAEMPQADIYGEDSFLSVALGLTREAGRVGRT